MICDNKHDSLRYSCLFKQTLFDSGKIYNFFLKLPFA